MRIFFSGIAGLVLLLSALLTLDRFVVVDVAVLAQASSFATYAVVGYVVAIVLLLLLVRGAKRRQVVLFGVVLALLGIGVHAYWLAPLYYGSAAGETDDVTVMTSNLDLGRADASTVVRTAADRKVDVLVLEEVTPQELTLLDRAGLDGLYDHRAGEARPGALGTMVFSTYALSDETPIQVSNKGVAVTVAAAKPFRLLAAHTVPPTADVARWSADLRTLRTDASAAVEDGPTVLAGDLNATTDHALFRRVLGAGLSDSTAQANSGWQPTWPTRYRRSFYRPVIAIDHVLTTSAFSATSTRTVEIPDSDHLALVVQLDRI